MASVKELQESFGIPGVLTFEEPHEGMICARVSTAACTAEVFLEGAHLTRWQPAGTAPVLFVSPKSAYTPGKPMRAGVPLIFPWFGPRSAEVSGGRTGGPMHGFARIEPWELTFAAQSGDEVHLAFALTPNETTREAGFDKFRAALQLRFGRELTMRFVVGNESGEPLTFEEGLHTYFEVSDVRNVRLTGLGGEEFVDKIDNFARKRQQQDVLVLTGETDRPYVNTKAAVTIEDPGLQRRIVMEKSGSDTTVVWNPWSETAAKIADLGAENWQHFVCVEAVNAFENRVTLPAGQAHVLEARVRVEPIA